ncbi:MAG: TolC family protein, partial [Planctomycetota bacterium]
MMPSLPRHAWIAVAALSLLVAADAASAQRADTTSSLSLLDALELALASHPALRAADAGVERAAADVSVATAEWFPQVGARAGLTQHQEPMLAYPLHELSAASPPIFDRTLIQGGVDLGWTAFDGGGRRARIGAARTHEEEASVLRDRSAMDVLADVSLAYLTVLSTAEVLEALDDQLTALEAEARRVDQFLAEGQAAAVEGLRVEAAAAQARAEHITVAARLDAAERTLARLLAVDPATVRHPHLLPLSLVG